MDMNWYKTSAFTDKGRVLILMRSPSCAGKSTLAQELGKGGVVFSTDDFFMKDGEYKFNPNLIGIFHKWNFNRTKQAMDKSISPIVVDNTNTTLKEILPYLDAARNHGYEVKYAYPDWHPDLKTPEGKWNYDFIIQQQRNKNRIDINKKVPEEVVKRQIGRFEYQLTNETDEQFSDRILKSFNK